MDYNSAKLGTLKDIIEMMDNHMLGGLKKKGEPKADTLEVSIDAAGKPGDEHNLHDALSQDDAKDPEEGDDGDKELIKKLVEMYAKEEDEEDGDKPNDDTAAL